jgi:hypothetical protein
MDIADAGDDNELAADGNEVAADGRTLRRRSSTGSAVASAPKRVRSLLNARCAAELRVLFLQRQRRPSTPTPKETAQCSVNLCERDGTLVQRSWQIMSAISRFVTTDGVDRPVFLCDKHKDEVQQASDKERHDSNKSACAKCDKVVPTKKARFVRANRYDWCFPCAGF